MPMWISWVNPRTQKRERIYNYFEPDSEEGGVSIRLARRLLSERFDIPRDAIPGFRVEAAPWITPSGEEAVREAEGIVARREE